MICFVLTTEEGPIEADCLVVKTKNLCHKDYAERSSPCPRRHAFTQHATAFGSLICNVSFSDRQECR